MSRYSSVLLLVPGLAFAVVVGTDACKDGVCPAGEEDNAALLQSRVAQTKVEAEKAKDVVNLQELAQQPQQDQPAPAQQDQPQQDQQPQQEQPHPLSIVSGAYRIVAEGTRCVDVAPLFKSDCRRVDQPCPFYAVDCERLCTFTSACSYFAYWSSTHCETYSSCPRTKSDNGLWSTVYQKK